MVCIAPRTEQDDHTHCAFFFTGLDWFRLTNLDRSRFDYECNQYYTDVFTSAAVTSNKDAVTLNNTSDYQGNRQTRVSIKGPIYKCIIKCNRQRQALVYKECQVKLREIRQKSYKYDAIYKK